jgi:hypothetical protein
MRAIASLLSLFPIDLVYLFPWPAEGANLSPWTYSGRESIRGDVTRITILSDADRQSRGANTPPYSL